MPTHVKLFTDRKLQSCIIFCLQLPLCVCFSSTPPGNPHPVQALPPQRNENMRSTQSQFRRPMNSDHRHPPTRVHSRHPPPVHEGPRQEIKQHSHGMYAPHQNNNIGDHQVTMNKQNSEQLTSSRTEPSEVNIASRMPQGR